MTAEDQGEMPYLLRIESVNLGSFIMDSDDLSTVRGGGLLLLGVHQLLTNWEWSPEHKRFQFGTQGLLGLDGQKDDEDPNAVQLRWILPADEKWNKHAVILERVSTGASIAIYSLDAEPRDAQLIRDRVDDWLRHHAQLRHATFGVAIAPIIPSRADGFSQATETTLQRVRRYQMRAPNVSLGPLHSKPLDDESLAKGALQFCNIDGKRSATEDLKKQSPSDPRTSYAKAVDKNFASAATHERRRYGRDTKIRLYHMIGNLASIADEEPFIPAWEFQDIATRGGRRVLADNAEPDPWARLTGKLAVLYIDGNRFAAQIQCKATDLNRYKEVDRKMLGKRRALMRDLVTRLQDEERPYWRVKPADPQSDSATSEQRDRYRIETLMWGGDELIWVVPAWCGLETVQFFFDRTNGWSLLDATGEPRLTHAMGLVFCSHKAPIRAVVKLAKDLAQSAKDAISEADALAESNGTKDDKTAYYNNPEANVLAYQVLESFDHIGDDFDAARRRHRFPSMRDDDAILTASGLNQLIDHMHKLRASGLPRSRLYQCAQMLCRTPSPLANEDRRRRQSLYDILMRRIAETSAGGVTEDLLNDPLHWGDRSKLPAKWYHLSELWDYIGTAAANATTKGVATVESEVQR